MYVEYVNSKSLNFSLYLNLISRSPFLCYTIAEKDFIFLVFWILKFSLTPFHKEIKKTETCYIFTLLSENSYLTLVFFT